MTRSLGEIEALARKAARGAGRSWGMAEEAGRAARWLAARGLPGPAALAALLIRTDGAAHATLCPRPHWAQGTQGTQGAQPRWHATGAVLCPLVAGTVLCDRGADLAPGDLPLTLGPTAQPLLVLPFVAALAQAAERDLSLGWPGMTAALGRGTVRLHAPQARPQPRAQARMPPQVPWVRLAAGPPGEGPELPPGTRGDMSAKAIEILDRFAARLLAPDTPESRLGGAGAGLRDTD